MNTTQIRAANLSGNDVLIIKGEPRKIKHLTLAFGKAHVTFLNGVEKSFDYEKWVTIRA